MRLPRPVVGILPQNHDSNLIERGQFQRGKAAAKRRKYALSGGFLGLEKRAEPPRFGRLQHGTQHLAPGFGQGSGIGHQLVIPGVP